MAKELLALKNEVDRIATATSFNGQNLLTGALTTALDGTSEIKVGTAISNNVVAAVDVGGANAGTTYNFTYVAGTNALTLTNATTSLAETITFGSAGRGR